MPIVNIPSEYTTDLEKTKYFYRLYYLIQEEGNKKKWDAKTTKMLNFWTKEVLKYRDKTNLTESDNWGELKESMKKDTTINANLSDLEGFE